jgi:hypothetical protein
VRSRARDDGPADSRYERKRSVRDRVCPRYDEDADEDPATAAEDPDAYSGGVDEEPSG